MSTYTQILYHLVYGTKNRENSLDLEKHGQLCKYIAGLLKNKKCVPHKIGGYSDHIHILLNLHPSVALSEIVKTIEDIVSKLKLQCVMIIGDKATAYIYVKGEGLKKCQSGDSVGNMFSVLDVGKNRADISIVGHKIILTK